MASPSASYSFTIRIVLPSAPGSFAQIAAAIGAAGGDLGAIDLVRAGSEGTVRDVTVNAGDSEHGKQIVEAVRAIPGVDVQSVSDRTFLLHLGGKIEVVSKSPLRTRDDLSMAYTPGVARVCLAIADVPERAWSLTIKRNTVAVVSDGSAVLGLGDIGPEAAMPVMEGKAMLFKEFGGVDAFPICLATKDVDEIVRTVKALSPGFGGINLEDISAPRCFEIERRLREELDIPVFHDDQHGTAVVVVAAFLNALRVVDKRAGDVSVVMVGTGAAGVACTKMLLAAGVRQIIGVDRMGALHRGRTGLDETKQWYAENTNPGGFTGSADEALKGADVFIGLSGPGSVSLDAVLSMADDAIVFAMANPTPEVPPEALAGRIAVVATGRSDYPNQINNVLAFPGIFRGALDVRASEINEEMKLAAGEALASVVTADELSAEYVIPSVFNRDVATVIAEAVAQAAIDSGVARRDTSASPAAEASSTPESMETVPLASADLVGAGVFPSISAAMQEHLLAADRTIRDLQSELARRDPAGSWWTGGVCLETLPQGQIRTYVAAYVYPRALIRDLSFEAQFYSELPGTWQVEAGVWVQSIEPVDMGQECAAEVALSTERTPEAAVEAYAAGALALAEAALSREPLGEAWRAN